ncbi:hypothetical protein GWI34_44255 [Actinomadura sp. DSM 109109]|nr:hypothetical protein [Actinomadura lepetitiana]
MESSVSDILDPQHPAEPPLGAVDHIGVHCKLEVGSEGVNIDMEPPSLVESHLLDRRGAPAFPQICGERSKFAADPGSLPELDQEHVMIGGVLDLEVAPL